MFVYGRRAQRKQTKAFISLLLFRKLALQPTRQRHQNKISNALGWPLKEMGVITWSEMREMYGEFMSKQMDLR